MLKVSKLTDYGTLVMGCLAQQPQSVLKANEVAELTGISLPTVSKLLKLLMRADLLMSLRGNHGGYRLKRDPQQISVGQIIRAIEGPLGLTECSVEEGLCDQESSCTVRINWQRVNQLVLGALETMSLAEFILPEAVPIHWMDKSGEPHRANG